MRRTFGELRGAINKRLKVEFAYTDRNAAASRRTVQPLGLFFWGGSWTLASWCNLCDGFRDFRIDRIVNLAISPIECEVVEGRTLADYIHYRETENG